MVEGGRTGAERGFLLNSSEMTTAGANDKYLMISVFPKSFSWAG